MTSTIQDIALGQFLLLALPILPVFFMLYAWKLELGKSLHAIVRMLLQLLAIGYVLTYLFSGGAELAGFAGAAHHDAGCDLDQSQSH